MGRCVRDNKLILWILLAVIIVIMLNLPQSVSQGIKHVVREATAPLQTGFTGLWRSAHDSVDAVRGLGGLVVENQRLSTENARLNTSLQDLRFLQRENEELRHQLKFKDRAARELIACEVIARDPDGWWQTIRLNKGREQGILPDMPVVSTEGLVGKTVEVSANTADVILVADPSCRVSCQIFRTGSFGVLTGRGPSWRGSVVCRMEFINKNTALQPGDEVITSGLGGVFPRGLLIGYIEKIYVDRSGLYQHADVITRSDLGSLRYVYVVKPGVSSDLYAPEREMPGEDPS